MSDNKKRRMSLLDNLAVHGMAPAPAMTVNNRALRSARDAVDGHRIWELDPEQIADDRTADRLDPADVADLRASIEAVGQTVPILVRRDPGDPDRYLLVYGRRRLEAVRGSDRVGKVRAMIAAMDDTAAIRAQASENTARRDLSFIERALFAQELSDSGFGTQSEIAEVLNLTKSAISMALGIARAIGRDLAQAIGAAHGVGRPRWEALARDLEQTPVPLPDLMAVAIETRAATDPDVADPSVAAFDAVIRRLRKAATVPVPPPDAPALPLSIAGAAQGRIRRTKDGLRMDLTIDDPEFALWLQEQAQDAITELHTRWKKRG